MARTRKFSFFIGIFILSTIVYFAMNNGQDMFLRWQFPTHHQEIVERYSDLMNVDPNLVYAIIKRESNFRANAVSPVGARGLMQLMDATAADISQRMGFDDFSPDDIFEPEVNIKIGVWYISHLLDIFDGNLVNALAAYNAGQGRVKEWLRNPDNVGDDGSLINIPYSETRHYVERVLYAMKIYERLRSE